MTRVAMVSSVSRDTPWAEITTPNHAEWCARHGATFIARHLPYDQAVGDFAFLLALLRHHDVVWCLDSDALVTDMTVGLESLGLRPGMNVCEEGLGLGPPINCGSVIWFGDEAQAMMRALIDAEPEWRRLTWIWQQWLGDRLDALRDELVAVHPAAAFNGCHHGSACVWTPGGFVYHPCGQPFDARVAALRERLADVRR